MGNRKKKKRLNAKAEPEKNVQKCMRLQCKDQMRLRIITASRFNLGY
jgi:hypothetical protein